MDSDKLAILVSMGFDIDLCEAILQIENLSIEEAVQRLLEAQKNSSREGVGNEGTSSVLPRHPTDAVAPEMLIDHQDMHEGEEDPVISRMALSERQRVIKMEFERKEREELQAAVRKRKMQDKHAKSNILQEIEANKRRIKNLRSDETSEYLEERTSASSCVTNLAEKEEGSMKLCRIQIRLPSGKNLMQRFPEDAHLSEVMDFAIENATASQEMVNPLLIRPFPRREFSNDDLGCTLLSLGLCPNASLVFVAAKHTAQHGVCTVTPASPVSSRIYDGGATDNVHSVHQTAHVPHHEWGQGARLSSEPSLDAQPHGSQSSTQHHERKANIEQSAILRALINSRGGDEGSSTGRVAVNEREDVPTENPASLSLTAEKSQRSAVAEAVERRRVSQKPSEHETKTESLSLARHIQPLMELCADCIAKSLVSQQGPVLSHIGRTLSHRAASQVIRALKARKWMTGKLLQLFHPCKLLHLDLDGYTLTSNEILEAARLHSTLVSLHLSQCSLLTDSGIITAVRGLKHLQVIDLSGCVQITDRALHEIKELVELKSLKLDNTKIKDDGLRDFLFNADRSNLLEFSANATSVSHKAFDKDRDGKVFNLITLHLDRTRVSSLNFVELFPSLRSLSLSGTPLAENALASIGCLCNLEELNLSHTTIPDHSLQCLAGLPLRSLGLPDRLLITDAALHHLEGLPLRSLDLSDYIHITDMGLASIGKITSLNSLSLANTKVTNDGIRHLKNLVNLQEADFARTQVGDEAIRMLIDLKSLRSLSLASTRITNEIFKDGTINSFENLQKLNVSRNRISDVGLRSLNLLFLELIHADQSFVSLASAACLPGCPNLRALRAQNCRSPTELAPENFV